MLKMRLGALPETEAKDATATGEVRTTLAHDVGAIIAPETEYRVVKWPNIRRRRQARAGKAAGLVDRNEVKAAIGVNIHAVVGLIIQRERER